LMHDLILSTKMDWSANLSLFVRWRLRKILFHSAAVLAFVSIGTLVALTEVIATTVVRKCYIIAVESRGSADPGSGHGHVV
jgi:hypothetical protein